MKIFIDDIRLAPEKYDLVFRTGESFLAWLKNNTSEQIELVSFDHDLGLDVIDGYELVKRMVEVPNQIERIQFHTDNLVGLKNMYMYIKNAQKYGLMPNLKKLRPKKIICIDGIETISNYYNANR